MQACNCIIRFVIFSLVSPANKMLNSAFEHLGIDLKLLCRCQLPMFLGEHDHLPFTVAAFTFLKSVKFTLNTRCVTCRQVTPFRSRIPGLLPRNASLRPSALHLPERADSSPEHNGTLDRIHRECQAKICHSILAS